MDLEERIARLEALAELEPEDAVTWFLLGQERLKADRFAAAAQALQQCVSLKPDYTAAWRFLGDARRKAGETEAAIAAYEQGMRVAEETGELQAGKEMQVFLRKLKPEAS